MLIISQNKECLINLEQCAIDIEEKEHEFRVVAFQNEDGYMLLGTYSKLEKAKNVIATIYRIYGGASKFEIPIDEE